MPLSSGDLNPRARVVADEQRLSYVATVRVELQDVTREQAERFFDQFGGQVIPLRVDGVLFEADVREVGVPRPRYAAEAD